MKLLFCFIGAYVGYIIGDWSNEEGLGAGLGFFIGWIAGAVIQQNKTIKNLEAQVKLIQSNLIDSRVDVEPSTPESPIPESSVVEDENIQHAHTVDTPDTVIQEQTQKQTQEDQEDDFSEDITQNVFTSTAVSSEENVDIWQESSAEAEIKPEPKEPDLFDKAINWLKDFFTTGNVVVKVGMIVLFFGVSFLLKYAAGKNVIPVEFWFIAVAIGSIGLLIFGWCLRFKNTTYALVIQGGALGLLYITLFSAAKFFTLIPLGLTFFLMFVLVVLSCRMAILQDSKSLAIFATIGGFLAPILTSSGSGNHVALFSYYAFLNAGILAIAWSRSWRILNWLGFVFTFVIASLWGYEGYRPEHFASTEPFLILFFLFYVAISVLFAHRQPPQLKGLVDGSLVFGVPLVGFTLQSALVKDFQYGQSFSAIAIAILYFILTKYLWDKQREGMRLLAESYLALGIIFISLAVPFMLDGHWTAAFWALEGAGIAWIGVKQSRLLARLFGLLLQIGGAAAFLIDASHRFAEYPVVNSAYIGSLLIAVSGLFIGRHYFKNKENLYAGERALHILLLIWGMLWWFGAGFVEIDEFVSEGYAFNTSLLFIAASLFCFSLIGRALLWKHLKSTGLFVLPVLYLFTFIAYADNNHISPLANLGYVSWISAFVIQYLLLYLASPKYASGNWSIGLMSLWHASTMWVYLFMLAWVLTHVIRDYLPEYDHWRYLLWGLIPATAIAKLLIIRDRFDWPIQQYKNAYLGWGLFPVVIVSSIWVVGTCFNRGDPSPFSYLPILNPQDIVQLFNIACIFIWLKLAKEGVLPGLPDIKAEVLLLLHAMVAFVWLNALVAHCVHYYAGVRYALDPMFDSATFQTSITLVWTITAFIIMGLASRYWQRQLWFVGAALLAAVVVKLFTVDLSDLGTVERIISFMSVGILMLVIGYITPIPPRDSDTGVSDEEADEI